MENRINKIVDHLVGSALPMESAISKFYLYNDRLMAAVMKRIKRNPETNKWERIHDTTQLQ